MSVDILVCKCGLRLKTPGAIPGRVGKCPRCGSLLEVPEKSREAVSPVEKALPDPSLTFIPTKGKAPDRLVLNRKVGDGFVSPPSVAETRWQVSLLYPLWNASGIGLLAFMPLGLWFATIPLLGIIPIMSSRSPFSLLGVILFLPQFLLLLAVGGYTLLFLGQVLVTSALGEVAQPRSPGWSLSEVGEGLQRWSWALLIGGVVGGFPALAYWVNCGDMDWLDWIVLIDLIIPGLAYAQMALLASLIFESPLAANPVTVVMAIWRLGWVYAGPCALTGSAAVALIGLLVLIFQSGDPLAMSIGFWIFWVVVLYVSMVVLRRLGLFCFRHAVIRDWFPDRSRADS